MVNDTIAPVHMRYYATIWAHGPRDESSALVACAYRLGSDGTHSRRGPDGAVREHRSPPGAGRLRFVLDRHFPRLGRADGVCLACDREAPVVVGAEVREPGLRCR